MVERRVWDWINKRRLMETGDLVLLALSGGADSLCLSRLLLDLREKLGIRLQAAHYNHGLRGAESRRDEAFVRQFCGEFDIPLTLGVGDVKKEARAAGTGIEETARQMRYAFLRETAAAVGATRIATAHNADDNVETVLLHLIRGTGIRGLAGIPPRRGEIVRPLLPVRRQEIVAYLARLGQPFVEDSSNQDRSRRRNALRHGVLPQLLEKNPNLAETVLRQSESLREDSRFLEDLARESLEGIRQQRDVRLAPWADAKEIRLSAAKLLALDRAIASRLLSLAAKELGGELDWVHIEKILDISAGSCPSAALDLRGDLLVRREYGDLVFAPKYGKISPFAPVILPPEGSVSIPEAGLFIVSTENFTKIHETFHTLLFKRAEICGKITVRPRREGDCLRLAGGNGTKTVKKWMIERKIPKNHRGQWPVFSDERGVIALWGVGVDQRVAPKAGDALRMITVEGILWKKT